MNQAANIKKMHRFTVAAMTMHSVYLCNMTWHTQHDMTYITWHGNITASLHNAAHLSQKAPVHTKEIQKACNVCCSKKTQKPKMPTLKNSVFCECVWFWALPATVGSLDLVVTEFQTVTVMSIKSTFLAVDLSFILLSSRETVRAHLHLVWLLGLLHLRANFECQVVTVWWMSKINIQTSRETGNKESPSFFFTQTRTFFKQ